MFHKMVGIAILRRSSSGKKRKRRSSHCNDPHPTKCDQQLFRALRCSNLAAARRALQNGADANARMPYGKTALHHVAGACHSNGTSSSSGNGSVRRVVKALLRAGADPTLPDTFGDTPLSLAAQRGNCAVVRLLLTAVDDAAFRQLARDSEGGGHTLLHHAAQSGSLPTVAEIMLRRGADPLTRNSFGFTAMDYTCSSSSSLQDSSSGGSVRAHLLHHYRETVLDREGPRALHHILRHTKSVPPPQQPQHEQQQQQQLVLPIGAVAVETLLQLLQKVVEREPDAVRTVDDAHRGDRPLHAALRRPGMPLPVLEFLQRRDASALTARNGDGDLPLHVACRTAGVLPAATLRWLLRQNGETVRTGDAAGALPLHIAARCSSDSVRAVQILAERYPPALRQRDNYGDLPLHHACRAARGLAVVRYLMQQCPGALRCRGRHGATPLHRACQAVAADKRTDDDSNSNTATTATAAALVQCVVRAYPEALAVPMTATGDLPFMLVAAAVAHASSNANGNRDDNSMDDDASSSSSQQLDILYSLLQTNPSVLALHQKKIIR